MTLDEARGDRLEVDAMARLTAFDRLAAEVEPVLAALGFQVSRTPGALSVSRSEGGTDGSAAWGSMRQVTVAHDVSQHGWVVTAISYEGTTQTGFTSDTQSLSVFEHATAAIARLRASYGV